MPGRDREASRHSGDLQAAIESVREEVLGLAASGKRRPPAQQPASPERPKLAAPAANPLPPATPPALHRPPLRLVRGALGAEGASAARPKVGGQPQWTGRTRRARRRAEPERAVRERIVLLPETVLRQIAEEIRSGTALVGGWTELLGLGTLTPQEAETACDRVRLAQARVEAAIRQLEAAAGGDQQTK